MKIFAIGAHPDDIEVGCAGTLMKYANYGHEIYLLVMTSGRNGRRCRPRKRSRFSPAELLKAKDLIWGGIPGHAADSSMNRMVYDIEILMKKIKPDFTLVNLWG